jgi:hypothetical protein
MKKFDNDNIIIIDLQMQLCHLSTQNVDNLSTFPHPVDNHENVKSYPHKMWITYPHYPHYPH